MVRESCWVTQEVRARTQTCPHTAALTSRHTRLTNTVEGCYKRYKPIRISEFHLNWMYYITKQGSWIFPHIDESKWQVVFYICHVIYSSVKWDRCQEFSWSFVCVKKTQDSMALASTWYGGIDISLQFHKHKVCRIASDYQLTSDKQYILKCKKMFLTKEKVC